MLYPLGKSHFVEVQSHQQGAARIKGIINPDRGVFSQCKGIWPIGRLVLLASEAKG